VFFDAIVFAVNKDLYIRTATVLLAQLVVASWAKNDTIFVRYFSDEYQSKCLIVSILRAI